MTLLAIIYVFCWIVALSWPVLLVEGLFWMFAFFNWLDERSLEKQEQRRQQEQNRRKVNR